MWAPAGVDLQQHSRCSSKKQATETFETRFCWKCKIWSVLLWYHLTFRILLLISDWRLMETLKRSHTAIKILRNTRSFNLSTVLYISCLSPVVSMVTETLGISIAIDRSWEALKTRNKNRWPHKCHQVLWEDCSTALGGTLEPHKQNSDQPGSPTGQETQRQ